MAQLLLGHCEVNSSEKKYLRSLPYLSSYFRMLCSYEAVGHGTMNILVYTLTFASLRAFDFC